MPVFCKDDDASGVMAGGMVEEDLCMVFTHREDVLGGETFEGWGRGDAFGGEFTFCAEGADVFFWAINGG